MVTVQRRGFLRAGLAVAGGVVLRRYREPFVPVHSAGAVVEDRGDFVIVRVPPFSSFVDHTLTTPAIFLLGAGASIHNVRVHGYANIYPGEGSVVSGCWFDCTGFTTDTARPALLVWNKGAHLTVDGCRTT